MFRLLKLSLFNHPFLKNLEIDLVSPTEIHKNKKLREPFTSLIIGPNGSGKSQLLRAIIDIFRELEYQKYREKKENVARFKFRIEYSLDDTLYSITCEGKSDKEYFVNGKEKSIFDIRLPEKMLASSFMLNDKFLFIDNERQKLKKIFYEYLGIRLNSSLAGTQSYQKKVVESIIDSALDSEFISNLKLVLDFLDYEPYFDISFYIRFWSYIIRDNFSEKDFIAFFENWRTVRPKRKTEPYSIFYFKKLNSSQIKGIVEFINYLKEKAVKYGKSPYLEYKLLFRGGDAVRLKNDAQNLKHLMKLDIISYPAIEIKKKEAFGLGESSSGEYHYISTIIGILSKVKKDTLILIDEPEISLHPTWQIKYIDNLKRIFNTYSSCHFILATHSHFMISDLKPDSSSIVSLRRRNGEIKAESERENTYGWAADDILYNVFEIPTIRNYYLASEIGDILKLVAEKDQNLGEIKRRVAELRKIDIKLRDIDPLKDIVDKLIDKFGRE